jgi:hypothetical protein
MVLSSADAPVSKVVGFQIQLEIVKCAKFTLESSIFSEKITFRELIFQLDIQFSIVSTVSIVGAVESIVNVFHN